MDACSKARPALATGRDPEALMSAARSGDRMALGRMLSLVERGGAPAREVSRLAFAASGREEFIVGITGAPGSGKSTLTNGLITAAHNRVDRVGVLAVDPSSPYSGGAILGDRIRMQGHVLDEGVFIRSMATRGHQGGLAIAAPEAIRVLAAAGMRVVLVETVGVGQVEVEIAAEADTTIVVVNPGWGDAIQASKAGLMEVADIFVINKADRPGVVETRRDLDMMLDLDLNMGDWRPPILQTVSTEGQGVEEVWEAVESHRDHLMASGGLSVRRDRRVIEELRRILTWRIDAKVRDISDGAPFESITADLLERKTDPYEAAERLLALM